jgi:purine-nucleoside phosphorylase
MQTYLRKVIEASEYLKANITVRPEIGLLTGTGLGDSIRSLNVSADFYYRDLPHFPTATVESHPGRLLFGRLGERRLMVLQGRFHLYEGYSPREVVFPIRVMQELGIKVLIVTNAAGGLDPDWQAGDIMIITDHINLTGANPLIGPNEERWGVRFPDMTRAYDPDLAALAASALRTAPSRVRKGVYAGLKGPALETPAEVRFLKKIGADAVGFSTVQEVIAAVHADMKVLGLSTITNINDPDHPQKATVEDIIAVANQAAPVLDAIIQIVVERMDARLLC